MLTVIRIFSIFFIIITAATNANAATLYRHLPFSASISPDDQIIIDYDFNAKKGIRCQANNNHVWVEFFYKGRKKSEHLPLQLENDHIPETEIEVLADSKGKLNIYIDEPETPARRIAIYCDYC